jgi:calpain-15
VFNTTTTNELWVMLLEKAWAKVHGGYMNISAGMSREALRDLTGAPTMLFNTRKPGNSGTLDDHWVNIIEAEDKHFILTAATADLRSDGSDGTDPVTGLSGNHGYSLLSAYEIY